MTRLAVLVTLGTLCAASAATAQGQVDKVDRGLQQALRAGARTQSVIISVRPGYRSTIRKALTDHGDRIIADHPMIDALSAEVHSEDVGQLARLAWVESVALDATVYAIGDGDDRLKSFTGVRTNPLRNMGGEVSANPLRETLGLPAEVSANGRSGVVVAVIDSGLALSDDLPAARIQGFYDYTAAGCSPVPCTPQPFDDFGHGTHIAGLIGSSGVLSGGRFQGIAPNVKYVGIKVLDATGAGTTSSVIQALEFLIDHPELNVRVVNLSLGHPILAPGRFDPLVRAVESATAAGLVVVVAAGNDGQCGPSDASGNQICGGPYYATINSPGNAPSAITVGAVDTRDTVSRNDDVLAAYSSRGPSWFDAVSKPDVVAPGHRLWSDATGVLPAPRGLWQQCLETEQNRGAVFCHEDTGDAQFLRLSGTSMATGVATGVVALVLTANSRLTPNVTKAILEYTAIPLPNLDVLAQGTGSLNAAGAVTLAASINTDTAAGTWWLTAGLRQSTVIDDSTLAWSENVIWGRAILGGDLVYRHLMIWSPNVRWGTDVRQTPVKGENSRALWRNLGTADIKIGERKTGDNGLRGTWDTHMATLSGPFRIQGLPSMLDGEAEVRATGDMIWGPNTTVRASDIVWQDNPTWGDWAFSTENDLTGGPLDNIIWGTSADANVDWGTARQADGQP